MQNFLKSMMFALLMLSASISIVKLAGVVQDFRSIGKPVIMDKQDPADVKAYRPEVQALHQRYRYPWNDIKDDQAEQVHKEVTEARVQLEKHYKKQKRKCRNFIGRFSSSSNPSCLNEEQRKYDHDDSILQIMLMSAGQKMRRLKTRESMNTGVSKPKWMDQKEIDEAAKRSERKIKAMIQRMQQESP